MHSRGNHQQDKMMTLRKVQSPCKVSKWEGSNLQNIQTAHVAQYKKKPIKKMGGIPKHAVLQRRHTHENMLNITIY